MSLVRLLLLSPLPVAESYSLALGVTSIVCGADPDCVHSLGQMSAVIMLIVAVCVLRMS